VFAGLNAGVKEISDSCQAIAALATLRPRISANSAATTGRPRWTTGRRAHSRCEGTKILCKSRVQERARP
jgi:hypothetical protein